MINTDTLHKIANLARLEFEPADEAKLLADLNKILDWVAMLQEVNTEGVEPLIHLSEEVNVFRADVVQNQIEREKALWNAPQKDEEYFKVPKVLDI
ncbi:MAG: Asp-tRNA(Asn)/Glu-tRNA(Gln) amidotransferase subunit GatC [Microscillaceae bacterium]|nr:Asp-tRNA(Asn)/Glu-tRNA(Gln) amidotransferase subunit GatC [Microscillaceae bacterium]